MRLTVAFITGRKDPRVDWTLDALAEQRKKDDEIHVVIVDALADKRSPGLVVDAHAFKRIIHVLPKPNIWQGEHRVTKEDWWAMSNARNTAFCYCDTEWIAFLDDRCKLGPFWLESIRKMASSSNPHVLCGTYEKWSGLEEGTCDARAGATKLMTGTPPWKLLAVDNRFRESGGAQNVDCGGQWLYGCTFALPLEWALDVNGFEEGCDGLSAEDYIFGMNLANAGYKLTFDPAMKVVQDRSPGHENAFRREDKGVSPRDKSHAALERFGKRSRAEFTPNLRELRAAVIARRPLPIPDPNADWRDWYDGQLVRDFR